MHLGGHCGGCGFGNQSCALARCSLEHGSIEYCFQCDKYPCERYESIDEYDSFITHQKRKADLRKAQQTVNLVLNTIRLAVKTEKVAAGRLQLHNDQGFQYTSQAYFNLTKEYGITPSMSRRGNCYDNAMAENFFSILKTECIYRQKIKTFQQANELIDDFIYFYNHERIQLKTEVAQRERRHSA